MNLASIERSDVADFASLLLLRKWSRFMVLGKREGLNAHPSARPCVGRSGRPIGDDREAIYREIYTMVPTNGEDLNSLSEVFDALHDWEHQLRHCDAAKRELAEIDLEGLDL